MKITVKTTQQKVFQLDAEPADTVAVLKQKISDAQGHPPATQKLIYSGKILADDKTVESCGIKEKDFLVLMVSKAKPAAAPSASSSQPAQPVSVPAQTTPAAPVPSAPVPPTPAPPAPVPASTTSTESLDATTSFLSGDRLQTAIDNLVEMGFPRDQVLQAMRASFNNPDCAVEYLTTGIPSHLEQPPQNAPPAPATQAAAPANPPTVTPPSAPANQPQNLFQVNHTSNNQLVEPSPLTPVQLAQQQQGSTAPTAGLPGAGSANPTAGLRGSGTIQQLRELLTAHPEAAQPLIQQLARGNPEIAQYLTENPDALFAMLEAASAGAGPRGDSDDAGDSIPPGAHVINVTPEERAAIQRLQDLGFSREQVLEAYLACDKNEELAANYLFESTFDD